MKNIKIELKLSLIYFAVLFFLILFSCTSNEFKEVKQSKPKTSKELANRSEPSLTNVDSTLETKVIPQVLPIVIPPIVPLPDPLPDPEPPYPDPYPFPDPEPPLELPEPEILKDSIVLFPEIVAEFPGGSQALKEFISQNIIFPQLCKENNIEGRVFVKFLVHSTGEISQIQIARGVHPQLDFEAKNVVKKMPLWNPALFQGRKVPSYAVIPVLFKIE
jgi:TonB family protein